jgi:phosphatidylglycerophosphate synthase
VYLLAGLAWVALANPASPALQVSLVRAHLAAPAIVYGVVPGRLGLLAVVLALAGLSDLVDGTFARRFDMPSMLGGGLDPVVDGVLLGAVAIGLALGGTLPPWLAVVIVMRYALPAVVALVLLSTGRRPELRHTVSGQVSTALIIILVGGLCLFRFLNQDAGNIVGGAEIVIPITTAAAFVHLGWLARRSSAPRPA